MKIKKQSGFTLIELLIVIGIIAILAGIVIIAVNPTKQFAEANNAQRQSDVNALLNAVSQYAVDNRGTLPAFVDGTVKTIASTTSGATVFCNDLVPTYISGLPFDPTATGADYINCTTFNSGYTITGSGGRINVAAPEAELSAIISVTR